MNLDLFALEIPYQQHEYELLLSMLTACPALAAATVSTESWCCSCKAHALYWRTAQVLSVQTKSSVKKITDQQQPPCPLGAAALQRHAAPAGVRLARLQRWRRGVDAHRPYPVQGRHLDIGMSRLACAGSSTTNAPMVTATGRNQHDNHAL